MVPKLCHRPCDRFIDWNFGNQLDNDKCRQVLNINTEKDI